LLSEVDLDNHTFNIVIVGTQDFREEVNV